jgi:hypothetical protein
MTLRDLIDRLIQIEGRASGASEVSVARGPSAPLQEAIKTMLVHASDVYDNSLGRPEWVRVRSRDLEAVEVLAGTPIRGAVITNVYVSDEQGIVIEAEEGGHE